MDGVVSGSTVDLKNLYEAQKISSEVVNPPLFLQFDKKFTESQEGLTYAAIQVYSGLYSTVSVINSGLKGLISAIIYVASMIFELIKPAIEPILNAVFPINPVNGERHFIGVPRSWELSLGKLLYDSMTAQYVEVGSHYGNQMEKTVSDVFHQIERSNSEILNPAKEEIKFDYHVKTVHSNQVNAFAMMGGGMVIFSKLVEDIRNALKNNEIQTTTIEFADGSIATVDLTRLTEEDVLAGLVGHEVTHVASRHSVFSLLGAVIRQIVLFIARFFLIHSLKSNDQEYQALVNKPSHERTFHEQYLLQKKEEDYDRVNSWIAWISHKLNAVLGLSYSKMHEYEADITGLYMSSKAGYNPLGAIYLQEVLGKGHKEGYLDLVHRNFEFLFTHPHRNNRERSLFAGLQKLCPNALDGRVTWTPPKVDGYDTSENAPLALRYAREQMAAG